MKISLCVITLNEEEDLSRCLSSVAGIVEEIIILDSGSTDRTREIALRHGAQFFSQPWLGYVAQKNKALSFARYDWVLFLDADEELSPYLRREILDWKSKQLPEAVAGFEMPRVVYFMGHWIRFGDWYPDLLVRLFRRGAGQFAGGAVHERLELNGGTKRLRGEIHHYTYRDLEDQNQRIEAYSTLWAESARNEGRRCSRWAPFVRSNWRLFRGFILKGGFLGGSLGWRISRSTAREVRLKYEKLLALQEGATSTP